MEMDKSYNGEMENVLTKTISYYTYCQNSYIQRVLKKIMLAKDICGPLWERKRSQNFENLLEKKGCSKLSQSFLPQNLIKKEWKGHLSVKEKYFFTFTSMNPIKI